MDKEQINQIALEVYGTSATDQELRFAALVAAQEREACALICEGQGDRAGVYSGQDAEISAGMECARLIRARKEET